MYVILLMFAILILILSQESRSIDSSGFLLCPKSRCDRTYK